MVVKLTLISLGNLRRFVYNTNIGTFVCHCIMLVSIICQINETAYTNFTISNNQKNLCHKSATKNSKLQQNMRPTILLPIKNKKYVDNINKYCKTTVCIVDYS